MKPMWFQNESDKSTPGPVQATKKRPDGATCVFLTTWAISTKLQMIPSRLSQVMSSTYTNRPEWQSLEDITGKSMKQVSRLEKHLRKEQDRKRLAKSKRAVEISIEGRKMAI